MPELKFACPGCGQHISCDELWGGHTIQCPACKQDLRVPLPPAAAPPAATAPRPSSLVPQPPAAPGKLSIGRPQAAASSAPAPSSPPPTPLRRHPAPSSKASSGLMKVVKIAAVVVGVVVGGYFGFTLVSNWQEKANAKRREVERTLMAANWDTSPTSTTCLTQPSRAAAAWAAAPAAPAPASARRPHPGPFPCRAKKPMPRPRGRQPASNCP